MSAAAVAKAAAEAAEMAKCKAAIKEMLEVNNRPYNGTNLVDDVAASYKKSMVLKALAALTEEKAITVKLFGKVKIYLADQSQFEDPGKVRSFFALAQVPDEATLAALDKECETLEQTLKTTLLEKDEITKQRAQIQSTPTNSELKAEVQHLAETTHAQTKQLQECESAIDANKKAGKGKTLSTHRALAADKKTLDQTLRVVERAACKRKRACRAAVLALEQGVNMHRNDLIELIGIDEDGYYDQLFLDD